MTHQPTFGQQLRMARRKAGLSIEDAASLMHRTPRLWKYWEADQRTPPKEKELLEQLTQEKLFKTLTRVQEIKALANEPTQR